MSSVTLNNLVKDYPEKGGKYFRAVKNINLEINEGEFMVLVGPSGCGKSTTLRMIAGLEDISGGTIQIGDTIVNNIQPKNRDIAMVFQNYALYPHMTLYDNMAFGLKLAKIPRDEINKRVLDAAKILGIEEMLLRKPKALSGGQRQRVAVGRAIVRQPAVFLFDEPLSNLDAKMRVSMRTEISKLHSRLKATMIYVTHDQVEAMTMGDRICVMKDGNILQVDGPMELYNQPNNMFVAGFIGSPPMNLIHGKVVAQDGSLWFAESEGDADSFRVKLDSRLSKLAQKYENKEIVFGVRPEDMHDPATKVEEVNGEMISAVVEVSEPMGSETYLYLRTGHNSVIARVNSGDRYPMMEKVSLMVNFDKVHLFDPTTEDVIR
ncbi:MAG: sn-glycerol-3-phosphate ABC transporter ATP-binding protein UgpC [Puniceicoccaceae bacterium]|nr:MAG: sn-glycerol-3-phosphate ABC transporter ATP-binding protein UgpC [Puniceicoccaceae bacterium]